MDGAWISIAIMLIGLVMFVVLQIQHSRRRRKDSLPKPGWLSFDEVARQVANDPNGALALALNSVLAHGFSPIFPCDYGLPINQLLEEPMKKIITLNGRDYDVPFLPQGGPEFTLQIQGLQFNLSRDEMRGLSRVIDGVLSNPDGGTIIVDRPVPKMNGSYIVGG